MVRDFYAPTLAHRVVVEVDIGALVEAVVRGNLGRRGDVVVDVCEAIHSQYRIKIRKATTTHSVKRETSPCCGGIVLV